MATWVRVQLPRRPFEEDKTEATPSAYPRPLYAWFVMSVLVMASLVSFVDRQHPGKEERRYQVEEARELLTRVGIKP